jgi:hypothetical protein
VSARPLSLPHPLGNKITRPLAARLLEREPTNLQALSLDTLIEKAVKHGTPFAPFFLGLLENWLNPTQRDILAWLSLVVLRPLAHS